MHVVQI